MGETLQIQWGSLDMLLEDMVTVKEQVASIDSYVGTFVCSTAGFDFTPFALKPLADAMGEMRGFFSSMRTTYETRFDGLVEATRNTAKDVYATDETIRFDIDKLTGRARTGLWRRARHRGPPQGRQRPCRPPQAASRGHAEVPEGPRRALPDGRRGLGRRA